jgi:hypothetical protein
MYKYIYEGADIEILNERDKEEKAWAEFFSCSLYEEGVREILRPVIWGLFENGEYNLTFARILKDAINTRKFDADRLEKWMDITIHPSWNKEDAVYAILSELKRYLYGGASADDVVDLWPKYMSARPDAEADATAE